MRARPTEDQLHRYEAAVIDTLYDKVPGFRAYYARFNALLARTDVLWTKPSELTFYAALGLPLVCGAPVGVHERHNRRWVREAGAGVKQRDARFAAEQGDSTPQGLQQFASQFTARAVVRIQQHLEAR